MIGKGFGTAGLWREVLTQALSGGTEESYRICRQKTRFRGLNRLTLSVTFNNDFFEGNKWKKITSISAVSRNRIFVALLLGKMTLWPSCGTDYVECCVVF